MNLRHSVIIPVYNGARFLAEAIQSVLAQTVPPDEIVVIDDGSTDDSLAIAKSYGTKVTAFTQSNAGPAGARNHGLRRTAGDFVSFLDADDLWLPDKTRLQLEAFQSTPALQIVFGRIEQFLNAGLAENERKILETRAGVMAAPHCGAMLARREVFEQAGPFDERMRLVDFPGWYMRVQEQGVHVQSIDAVVLRRRMHENNLTRNRANYGEYLLAIKQSLDRRRAATP